MIVVNLVTPKAAAKHELLFNLALDTFIVQPTGVMIVNDNCNPFMVRATGDTKAKKESFNFFISGILTNYIFVI